MAAQVLSFFQRSPRPTDWSQQELAEFYRVESALIRAGISVGTDRGMSDENEPWFVFFRQDDGEVVIHFARIDGEYIIVGSAYEEIARGFDFSTLVRNMVARHPLIRRSDSNSNLSIHPAALLVAVVGTAFFKTGEARASESGATNTAASSHSRPVLLSSSAAVINGVAPMAMQQPGYDSVLIPANQAVLVLAAALLASDYGAQPAPQDPGLKAAIASAAAALDFTGVALPSTAVTDTAVTSSAAPTVTAASSPVHMVSSVLSLVSILSTLPQIQGPTASEAMIATDVAKHDPIVSTAIPSMDNGNWAIDVRLNLSSPTLPTVEAVQLVRGVVGTSDYQKITVIEVAKLPDVLAEIVERGAHYTTTPGGSDSLNPLPGHGNGLPPPTNEQTEQPQPSTPPAPEKPIFASADMVKQFVDYFMDHVTLVDIVVNGSEIIILDNRVLNDMKAINQLHSMTFDFADGSSISLVGDHSSFLHGGILV